MPLSKGGQDIVNMGSEISARIDGPTPQNLNTHSTQGEQGKVGSTKEELNIDQLEEEFNAIDDQNVDQE